MRICDVALPKTANPEHIKTNSEVDFEISNGDMEILKNLKRLKITEKAAFSLYMEESYNKYKEYKEWRQYRK